VSDFVRECQKEWRRLGVPTSMANEMASDLSADLAEAAADGLSPEHVLGNGVFDPRSFAAEWASARGLVGNQTAERRRFARLVVPISVAVASVHAILVGLALLGRPHVTAAVTGAPRAFRVRPPLPPPSLHIASPGPINHPLGVALFGIGLAGLVVSLVLWKPWQFRRMRGA